MRCNILLFMLLVLEVVLLPVILLLAVHLHAAEGCLGLIGVTVPLMSTLQATPPGQLAPPPALRVCLVGGTMQCHPLVYLCPGGGTPAHHLRPPLQQRKTLSLISVALAPTVKL